MYLELKYIDLSISPTSISVLIGSLYFILRFSDTKFIVTHVVLYSRAPYYYIHRLPEIPTSYMGLVALRGDGCDEALA